MFKNEFQGGPYVELFSVQGKDPLSKVKTSGPHTCVKKEFDNALRTFVLNLDGESSRTRILFPKNSKQSLHITQPYLVFQIYIHSGRTFSLEVSLTDQKNLKQRLILSSSSKEVIVTALHVKMPCSIIETNVWLNLCLDLNGLLSSTDDKFSLLDSYIISANCQLRRVFTLKNKPESNVDIPKNVYLGDVPTMLQLLDMNSFIEAGINIRSGTGKRSLSIRQRIPQDQVHVAFGSKVLTRSDSNPKDDISTRLIKKNIDINNNKTDDSLPSKDDSNNELLQSNKAGLIPRPPKLNQGRVRKPRIKSADYSKQKLSDPSKTKSLSKSADTRGRKKYLEQSNDQLLPSKSLRKNSEHNEIERLEKVNKQLPPVQFKKTLSKSAIDLEITNNLKESSANDSFRSKSLTILPNIKRTSISESNLETDNLKENKVFPSLSNDEPLCLGDDGMIEEYLRRRTTSSCTHDDSFSSSCATSNNSDLYLYSSRPKSVSCPPLVNQRDMDGVVTQELNHSKVESGTEIIVTLDERSAVDTMNSSSGISSSLSKNGPNDMLQDRDNINEVDLKSSSPVLKFSLESPQLHFIFSKDEEALQEFDGTNNMTADVANFENGGKNNQEEDVNKAQNLDNLDSDLPQFHQYKPSSSIESDTMSWLNASVDPSESSKLDALNINFPNSNQLKASPKLQLRQRLVEQLGSVITHSKELDTDDGFSDCSDDTTLIEPPLRFHNYRYQDEIKSIGSTIDLAATIPATPQVGEQACDNEKDENNNTGYSNRGLKQSNNEELLDLLFDPVLNCYYDPKTEKYYELS